MESLLRLLLLLAKLPRPKAQVHLYDADGSFFGRPDLYHPVQRLVIEYDGGTHRDTLTEDHRCQNRLFAAGYRVLRFTAPDICERPEAVVALVKSELSRRRF